MKIAILGCGNMGTAYARSFRKYGLVKPEDLHLVIRGDAHRARLETLGQVTTAIDTGISASSLVIIAVKPQDFGSIAPALADVLRPEQVVLSIMAGITLERLKTSLRHATIVRAMPNAPAQIGMGITAYATGTELNMRQTLMVEQLLNCTGRAMHLADEALLDPVTALSGSGPAYFFEVVRTMIATLPIAVVPLGDEIAVAAAGLRARHPSLKLPDALVIATAEEEGADKLLTTDRRWPSARHLGISTKLQVM